MGTPGCILKRRYDINIEQLINDINLAARRANLLTEMHEKRYSEDTHEFEYVTFNIFDSDMKQDVLLYLFNISDCDYDEEFDWIAPGEKLIHIMNVENFYECERLMLDFIYEYLLINKKDILWNDQEWFYTHDAIKTIKSREFDSEWCYKPFTE